jgi:hypothetical protein
MPISSGGLDDQNDNGGEREGVTLMAKDPGLHDGKLKAIGGSKSDDWNNASPTRRSTPFGSSTRMIRGAPDRWRRQSPA